MYCQLSQLRTISSTSAGLGRVACALFVIQFACDIDSLLLHLVALAIGAGHSLLHIWVSYMVSRILRIWFHI